MGVRVLAKPAAVALIRSGEYRGGNFVVVPEAGKAITAKDVAHNYVWLRPVVEEIRDKVPSVHLLADMLLP